MYGEQPCLAREEGRHPGLISKVTRVDQRTHLFPSELCNVFEVNAGGETDGAVWGVIKDEGEQMGKKTRLKSELVELLLCLFSRGRLEGGAEQGGDVGHGRSQQSRSRPFQYSNALCLSLITLPTHLAQHAL